ncbi:hypothetical protein GYA49_00280 [Candidatus Beckwithbacteria bacterium]|nr:hypothetical protein [Candidatus Beckwithbacteria bacterium]
MQKNVYLPPLAFSCLIVLFHIFLSKKYKIKLSEQFVSSNLIFLPIVFGILGAFAFFLEELGPLFPNYFFANYKIHYIVFPYIALSCMLFGFVHCSKEKIETYMKQLVPIVTCALCIFAGLLYFSEPLVYKELVKEDSVVENITALGYFASGITAFILAKKTSSNRSIAFHKILSLLCIVVGIGFIFVSLEEISWGQRIFHFQTPAAIAEHNRQAEINLHNSEALWPFVYKAYLAIGLYGMLAWLVDWISKDLYILPKKYQLWKKICIPKSYLFANFFLIVLYVWLRSHHGPWKYQLLEEFSEMILAIGISIHLIEATVHIFDPNEQVED